MTNPFRETGKECPQCQIPTLTAFAPMMITNISAQSRTKRSPSIRCTVRIASRPPASVMRYASKHSGNSGMPGKEGQKTKECGLYVTPSDPWRVTTYRPGMRTRPRKGNAVRIRVTTVEGKEETVMNPMTKVRGLALGMRPTVRATLSRGSSRAIGHMLYRVIAGVPGGLTCHDVGRSAPAIAGSVASSDGPREETAPTNAAHRSSPLPVQEVTRCAQHRKCIIV